MVCHIQHQIFNSSDFSLNQIAQFSQYISNYEFKALCNCHITYKYWHKTISKILDCNGIMARNMKTTWDGLMEGATLRECGKCIGNVYGLEWWTR